MIVGEKRKILLALFCTVGLPVAASATDWPQWGGRDGRNLVSDEKGLPDFFKPGNKTGGAIDPQTTQNVRWTARLGSGAYGNPTVAGGRVFVGTDALTLEDDPRFDYVRGGMVKCFDEENGTLLWQLPIPIRNDLPKEVLFGHQYLGVCSSPAVDGDRVYVVGTRADILCLDVHGQANGNDGPFLDEARYMTSPGKPPVTLKPTDGDILWQFDPLQQLGVRPHDAASCSVLVHGDFLYVGSSNGVDKPHKKVLSPLAPSLIVLDKMTGRLVATDDEKIGTRLYHCQWAPPSLGEVGDKTLVFFGGGDGVCYAFEALTKASDKPVHLRTVWKYDCNPPEYKFRDGKPIPYYAGDKRKKWSTNKNDGQYVGPSQIIATPVFVDGRVYIAIGQDPAHGRGKGLLHCIDATQTGDITQTGCVWKYDGMDRSISTVAVADGLVYAVDVAGRLHCLDADTGKCYWVYETKAETWSAPLWADGKVYLGNKRDFLILAAGKTLNVLNRIRLGSPVYSTTVAANGALWTASQHYLWCVANTALPAHTSVPDSPQETETRPVASKVETQGNWPRFRGPDGLGICGSDSKDVPISWNAASGDGIVWKVPVPLAGNNSPIVWNDRVFLSGATEKQREVYCFEANTGKQLWQKEVPKTSKTPAKAPEVMDKTGFAASTTATDGERVYSMFADGDVAAFDYDGRSVWTVSLGLPDNPYGHASSLLVHGRLLVIQFDQGAAKDKLSKVLALDCATGKTVWEQRRQVPSSWATPIVIDVKGQSQIVTVGDPWVVAYAPADGSEIWRAKCLHADVGPSPVFANGLVFATNEYSELSAIRADGKGDVTETHILWKGEDGLPDTVSPLATREFVFVLTSYGILTCYDAKNGEVLWTEEFEDAAFASSPSLVDGRLYLFSEEGKAWVVKPSRDGCERLSASDLGEGCVTSPAFQNGRIYIRGTQHLFCLGKK